MKEIFSQRSRSACASTIDSHSHMKQSRFDVQLINYANRLQLCKNEFHCGNISNHHKYWYDASQSRTLHQPQEFTSSFHYRLESKSKSVSARNSWVAWSCRCCNSAISLSFTRGHNMKKKHVTAGPAGDQDWREREKKYEVSANHVTSWCTADRAFSHLEMAENKKEKNFQFSAMSRFLLQHRFAVLCHFRSRHQWALGLDIITSPHSCLLFRLVLNWLCTICKLSCLAFFMLFFSACALKINSEKILSNRSAAHNYSTARFESLRNFICVTSFSETNFFPSKDSTHIPEISFFYYFTSDRTNEKLWRNFLRNDSRGV